MTECTLMYKNNCKFCSSFTGVRTNYKSNKRIFECKECFLFFKTIRELCQFCYAKKYAWEKDGLRACTKCVCAGALRNTVEVDGS